MCIHVVIYVEIVLDRALCVLNPFDNRLIGTFRSLMLNMIIDMVRSVSTMFVTVFYFWFLFLAPIFVFCSFSAFCSLVEHFI